MSHHSTITDNGVHLDIATFGFWGGKFEKAFLGVRVFNPRAQRIGRSLYHLHTDDMSRKTRSSMSNGYTGSGTFHLSSLVMPTT